MIVKDQMTNPTISELLQNAEQQLHALDTARIDAEVLLCHVTGLERTKLYSHPEQTISDDMIHTYQSLLEKRHDAQPVAYLTGTKEFWSMEFKVTEQTLIPRPETECLVEEALKHIPENKKYNILDLGTGCGAIAIAIAKERPGCRITATDINEGALLIAKENSMKLNINNVSFVTSDWYTNIDGQYDYIISNPPYIKQDDEHLKLGDVQYEPQLALAAGDDGLQAIRHIIAKASKYLKNDAWILLEHGYDQGVETCSILHKHGFIETSTRSDYSGHGRVSFGKNMPVDFY